MNKFKNFQDLIHYTVERSKLGTERWFAVRYKCADGLIATLPGRNNPLFPLEKSSDFVFALEMDYRDFYLNQSS